MTRRNAGLVPTLFPFLAVLVCTMGTLILLLALVVRRAEAATRAEAEQAASHIAKTVDRDLKESGWQREALLKLRDQQTALVQQKRDELAHLEEHIRTIEQQLKQLAEQIAAAESQNDSSDGLQQRVDELEQRLSKRRSELEELSESQESRGRARIAIVPHRGPNGTSRRPIYLECVADRVIIQPEGLEVPSELLRGPLGPGGPLDATLRAARTYFARVVGDPEPPYPLLVVRPDGVMAYAAARVSMTAWNDAFGYELVPADVELAYPAADPRLRERMEEALLEAVERQRAVVAAMPNRFRGFGGRQPTALEEGMRRSASALAQSANGGVMGAGAGAQTAEAERWRGEVHRVLAGETTAGTAAGGAERGARHGGTVAGTASGTAAEGADGHRAALASAGRGRSAGFAEAGLGQAGGRQQMSGAMAGERDGGGSNGEFGSRSAGSADALAAEAEALSAESPDGGSSASAEGDGTSAGAAGGETAATGTSPYGTTAKTPAAPLGMGAQGAAAGGAAMGGTPIDGDANAAAEAAAEIATAPPAAMQPLEPLASSRGRDWALDPGIQRRGAAVRRNIAVVIHENHYEIPAGPGGSTRMVMIDPHQPERAVVQVAAEVARRVDNWGVALSNGHWAPVIRARTLDGGEAAFEQLQTLLHGSGVQVEREEQR